MEQAQSRIEFQYIEAAIELARDNLKKFKETDDIRYAMIAGDELDSAKELAFELIKEETENNG